MMLIYVDDMIVTRNDTIVIKAICGKLNKLSALKDHGSLHHFSGFEAFRDESNIYIT